MVLKSFYKSSKINPVDFLFILFYLKNCVTLNN
uniref:Uncharacterized protein n=1 Tax=Megaselia scalaris TaxID=36166 RepID=T1GRX4_MEGSC